MYPSNFQNWNMEGWHQITQLFYRIGFPQYIRSSRNESCKIHWHVMNDVAFGSLNVVMLQTANWMISYLLKAYLVKIVQIDTLNSSNTRPCLDYPLCNASVTSKDYMVVKPENWWVNSISGQNWGYMWGRHTQRQCQD